MNPNKIPFQILLLLSGTHHLQLAGKSRMAEAVHRELFRVMDTASAFRWITYLLSKVPDGLSPEQTGK